MKLLGCCWQTEVLTSSIVLKIGNDNKLVVITSVEVWLWVSRVFYISLNPAGLGQDREFSSLFPFYYRRTYLRKRLFFLLLLLLIFDKSEYRTVYTVFENHRKKSHSTLRAKRAMFTFKSGQKLIKNAKNGPFWRVFEILKLAVKQCYQTGQF